MMEKKVIFEAKDLFKQYGSGSGTTVALDHVSLKIYQGELLVILGSSGSGKSTLLNMIGGMDRPTSGGIYIDGNNICNYSDKQMTTYRREKVGFVFQSFNLIQELTARENVALTADKSGQSVSIEDAFAIVGLSRKQNRYPSELSGGMQKRVGIARAIALSPRYLFCDEPNSGLDPKTSLIIDDLIFDITHEFGITTVVNTHDLNSVITIGETISYIYEGNLAWTGSMDTVLTSDNQLLNEFIYAQPLTQKIKQKL